MALSIKNLVNHGYTPEQATFIREALLKFEAKHSKWVRPEKTFKKISEFLNKFGVQRIPAGTNQKSPEIMYIDTGDMYDTTLMWVNNHVSIGYVAYIIERGNYPDP